jgi:U3 small nucleolar RNA-associated protein 25
VELKKKPDDYVDRFSQNTDDSFAFGLRFNYESIRLCCSFESSDVIVASALGIATLFGDDFDALSSLEVLLLDSAEVLLMQVRERIVISILILTLILI